METNESILTREIVSIDDRKRLGKLKDLCVDCDTLAVSHYIVSSATTNAPIVLPFSKSLAVGDTFMTIQSREDFIPTSEEEAQKAIEDGFRLIGVEVFSRTGNRLGVVESYEFDPTYGLITKVILGKRLSYPAESFVFFAPEFIFVDDGEATAQDLRTGTKSRPKKKTNTKIFAKSPRKAPVKAVEAKAEVSSPVEAITEDAAMEDFNGTVVEEEVVEAVEANEIQDENTVQDAFTTEVSSSDEAEEDTVLKEFLLGAVVNDEVESKDGVFKVAKGTRLTKELIDEAQKHDALLLLTMSVDA